MDNNNKTGLKTELHKKLTNANNSTTLKVLDTTC